MKSILSRLVWIQLAGAGSVVAIVLTIAAWRGQPDLQGLAWMLGAAQLCITVAAMLATRRTWRRWQQAREALCEHILAVGDAEFTERREPEAEEWAPVGRAMNVMVARLRDAAEVRDRLLSHLQGEVRTDALTGLPSRIQFMEQLKLQLDAANGVHGAVILIRISDLAGINQREGRELGDELLRSVAAVLRLHAALLRNAQMFSSRLNGADFGVLLRNTTQRELQSAVRGLHDGLMRLHDQGLSPLSLPAMIGVAVVEPGSAVAEAMGCADAMLQECETTRQGWRIGTPGNVVARPSVGQWRRLIDDALETGRVRLMRRSIAAFDWAPTHDEVQIELQDGKGVALDVGECHAAALRTQRIDELDLRKVELSIVRLMQKDVPVAVTLHGSSCARPSFVRRVGIVLELAAAQCRQLWIELDLRGEAQTFDDYAALLALLKKLSIRSGARQVPQESALLDRLREAGVSYVRVSEDFGDPTHGSTALERDRFFERLAGAAGLSILVPRSAKEGLRQAERAQRALRKV